MQLGYELYRCEKSVGGSHWLGVSRASGGRGVDGWGQQTMTSCNEKTVVNHETATISQPLLHVIKKEWCGHCVSSTTAVTSPLCRALVAHSLTFSLAKF